MYRGVIFDIDGTLVDSNDAHAQAWVRALEEHGRHVEFARVRPLIGKGSDKLLPELTGITVDSPEGRALVERRREIFMRDFMLTLKPTRGAQRLLEWLRDERLTLGIATSAADEEVHSLLRVAGATKYFDTKTSSDDVDRSKPDPDIVRAALERMGCSAGDVVMIGDTPYDVEAALRAGVGIIAFRSGGWSAEALSGALAVYDDPEDLLDHFDESPFKRPLPVSSAPR
jgi:HAD superfamily hydrolase (TIGR01509 family)